MHSSNDKVLYTSVYCEGVISFDSGSIHMDLVCHPHATDLFSSIFENALRVMVAYSVLKKGGFMLHSASLVCDDEAVLLVGHSGAGKSTCSQMALDAGHFVISDDINVVLPNDAGGWKVVRVPFNGTVETPPIRQPRSSEVRLQAIYILNQSGVTCSTSVSRATAVAKLYASLPFVNLDMHGRITIIESLSNLAGKIPIRTLEFSKDPGFLEILREAA